MLLTEEQKHIKESIRRFVEAEVRPNAIAMDRDAKLPEDIWSKLAELGILGATVSPEYGGAGVDPLTQVIIGEELAKGSSGIAMSYLGHANLCCHNLHHHGNEYQLARYLPDLCCGKKIGGLALTEPSGGSDATGIKTRAVKEGDFYRLNGSKMFITNAPIADVLIVYAKTDMEAGPHGISAFIVDIPSAGLTVGKKLDKVGNRASPTSEVVFEDVMVPAKNLLLGENQGVKVMMSGLDIERVVVAGVSLGIAEQAYAEAVQYSLDRKQFGKRICEFQLIQAKIANMYTGIETARAFLYQIATQIDNGSRLRKEAAAAVLYTSEMATKVCDDAVQIHGGYGYMKEFPVNMYLRDAKLFEIGAGTSEIRRELIAKEVIRNV